MSESPDLPLNALYLRTASTNLTSSLSPLSSLLAPASMLRSPLSSPLINSNIRIPQETLSHLSSFEVSNSISQFVVLSCPIPVSKLCNEASSLPSLLILKVSWKGREHCLGTPGSIGLFNIVEVLRHFETAPFCSNLHAQMSQHVFRPIARCHQGLMNHLQCQSARGQACERPKC